MEKTQCLEDFMATEIPSTVSDGISFSTIDAAKQLANALLDLSNEHFVLLSPACIPLFNFNFTYKYLMSSKYSFVEAFDVPGPGSRDRYTPNSHPRSTSCCCARARSGWRSITWELWRSGQFEPVTFGMEDNTEELLQKINEEHECFHNDKPTAVCFLFARRFAPSALWPLLKLALTSLGFGSQETS
ncbi:Core-2/I-Branching enzyme [Musa troglodytarum]|uniref:Core-2/I-Branching enzyme n=1 Tax=Musa troglodytarum TaxID=320322 RepID=A0A9E7JMC8_9LILI|nr:Core-2/I-Branching enzyme [Musa troglodytarum]